MADSHLMYFRSIIRKQNKGLPSLGFFHSRQPKTLVWPNKRPTTKKYGLKGGPALDRQAIKQKLVKMGQKAEKE